MGWGSATEGHQGILTGAKTSTVNTVNSARIVILIITIAVVDVLSLVSPECELR